MKKIISVLLVLSLLMAGCLERDFRGVSGVEGAGDVLAEPCECKNSFTVSGGDIPKLGYLLSLPRGVQRVG